MSTMLPASRSSPSLKRERDEDDDLETPLYIPDGEGFIKGENDEDDNFETPHPVPDCEVTHAFSTPTRNRTTNIKSESSPVSLTSTKRASSPARSSTGSLSDAGTSTPVGLRPSPTTAFTALNGVVQPPKKRAKLTFAEKEEQRILKAVRDQEKAEERAQREIVKKAKEEDKARRDTEKEAERKRKEAEREEKRLAKEAERAEKEEKKLIKEAERAEKDKEKKAKEDEKRRKEEEKQRIEEEKRKKERSQPKLNAFFKKPGTLPAGDGPRKSPTPAPGAAIQSSILVTKSPCKVDSMPEYQKRFPPFFVQSNVKVAPFIQFSRDECASNVLQDAIDSYIHGGRSSEKIRPFDPVRLFNLAESDLKPRGKTITPVREIMSQILGNAKRPIDLTTDSQNIQIKNTRNLLRKIPYKILSFAEDVRPPYKGTYTSQPMSGMRRMARNPTRRDLPHVNYDYDSEAEWEDDDGEDVESDCNDDEEIGDGGEDLEEFLDDAEAETLNARKLVMQGDLELKCSGLCWEDQKRRGPNVKMYRYLMEIINEDTQIRTPIDPFATHYWDAPAPAGLMEPPRMPLNAIKSTNAGMNGPNNKPAHLFGTIDTKKSATQCSSAAHHPKKLVSMEDMPAFKDAVHGNELSKLGLIEVLNKQFSKISKSTIKYTLETIAKRVGNKEAEKRWVLIEETTR